MRIKRFEAPDNQTALRMVKKEMGDDALILATRTLAPAERKKGGNVKVEVVAAVDFDVNKITESTTTAADNDTASATDIYDYSIVRQKELGKSSSNEQSTRRNNPPQPNVHSNETPPRRPNNSYLMQKDAKIAAAGDSVELDIAVSELPHVRRSEKPDPAKVARWRQQLIDQIVIQPLSVMRDHNRPTVLALVGATGVGKTTTAAKLAAWYSLREGLKVTLISMDCYRIGATDQLRTYAKIMRLPCEIALHRNDLAKAIERHQGQDLIIVDTAGKSPYNKDHVAELADWFECAPGIEPYVVVSATAKKEDLTHILRTYRPLMPAGIMVTKLDETRAYATLCQTLAASALPITSLSIGQKVPEDFLPASKDYLATLFQEGWHAVAGGMGAA